MREFRRFMFGMIRLLGLRPKHRHPVIVVQPPYLR